VDERSLRNLNLALRFVLELLVLVGLFLWGISASDDLPFQLVAGLGLPLLVMVVWGLFVAPKARYRLKDPTRLVVEIGVWALGTLAFGFAVSWILAGIFGLAVLISLALMFYWGQRGR
jgi:uncharacterized membrane protein